MKFIKQISTNDCGAACMAMICSQYKMKLSLTKAREIAMTDSQGNNFFGLINGFKKLGFEATAVKGDTKAFLSGFQVPAIANIALGDGTGHYIVIRKVSNKKVYVFNPAKGKEKYAFDEFFQIWTGALLLIRPQKINKSVTNSTVSRAIIKNIVSSNSKLFIIIAVLSVFVTFLGICLSSVYGILMDDIIPYKNHELLFSLFISVCVYTALKISVSFFRTKLLVYVGCKIDSIIMPGFLSKINRLPLSFFNNYTVGEVLSRFSDAENIREALSETVLTILVDTTMAVITGIFLCRISVLLFLITLAMVVIYGVCVLCYNKSIRQKTEIVRERDSELLSFTYETIRNAESIKSFQGEKNINQKTRNIFEKYLLGYKKLAYTQNSQESLTNFISSFGSMTILFLGADLIIHENITIGLFLQFSALMAYFVDPIQSLIRIQTTIQSAVVSANRIFGIMELEDEPQNANGKTVESLNENITFKNVNFRYMARDLVLSKASLCIKAGEKVAIVGESGSGKTTIAKILMKFYPYETGSVQIGSNELSEINTQFLRRKIAYVSQDIELFTGTVKENLLFAKPDATDSELIEACKLSCTFDYIGKTNEGLNYILDEGGSNLSLGERQRLSLARAFLLNPDILILDEVTGNIDTVNENIIWSNIISHFENTTVICIAHRLSTVCKCDKIFVMDNHKIGEEGTHEELIHNQGKYYSLWVNQ